MARAAAAEKHGFRLGLGHPVLEFVATLGRRRVTPVERLSEPEDLSCWLGLAQVARGARCDPEHVVDARELREALYRLLMAAREARRPARADLELINAWARQPTPSPQLDASLQITHAGPDPCRAALAQLARAGIELVAGDQLPQIRNCSNPTCSLMFIDHSRPGRRRWCSMERCGNRAKTARYRRHRRTAV